jgi:formate dehydrogenase iron-sulfur subunit
MGAIGMVIDTSKCTACRACMVVCKQWHSLPAEGHIQDPISGEWHTEFKGVYTNPPDLSGATLTLIRFKEAEVGEKLRFLFFNDRCRHCETPTCRQACPLVPKAIKRQKNGIVRIDPDLCRPDLCSSKDVKPCQQACPFKIDGNPVGIPKWKYMRNGELIETKMRKCDFCYNRMNASPEATKLKSPPFLSSDGLTKSALPSCAVTCPPGAIKVYSAKTSAGVIKKIRNKAIERVTVLKANGYPNAQVYPAGLQTHVVWVLIESPSAYGITPA